LLFLTFFTPFTFLFYVSFYLCTLEGLLITIIYLIMNVLEVLAKLKQKFPNEPEYHQAVEEVLLSIEDEYNKHPEFEKYNLIERLCIPDRIFTFRINWIDDKGVVQTNMAYRIQHSMAIGPYKGGLRFHPSVYPGLLKFLAFEQTFKNALTTLPMGGAKGGSDFDPKGKSDAEVMRFCQAFMFELWKQIGPDTDVPAGDIGVGGREIGYLFGMYKKLTRTHVGVLTGKGNEFGGSLIRPEATGYGTVYFAEEMLKLKGDSMKGKTVAISGSGNVAQYAVEKCLHLGAKPVTLSDSSGYIYDPDGIDAEKLKYVMWLKEEKRGRISEYAEKYGCKFVAGERPWEVKVDVALPCATQNELDEINAKILIANGCICIAEGANMPSTPEAIEIIQASHILYAPGKASNAGGVATSGLEMSQNSLKLSWTREEVDARLLKIMQDIHATCVQYGKKADGSIDYVKGANIGGFMKVAKAMMAQGII
jgi:glutamate dehydrogenase (NADP+)